MKSLLPRPTRKQNSRKYPGLEHEDIVAVCQYAVYVVKTRPTMRSPDANPAR